MTSGQWQGSTRRARLPRDWHRRRAVVKRKANNQCEQMVDGVRCVSIGTDVDHINRLGSDDIDNLRLLCAAHHKVKSSAEGVAARIPRARPAEKHPGLR